MSSEIKSYKDLIIWQKGIDLVIDAPVKSRNIHNIVIPVKTGIQ